MINRQMEQDAKEKSVAKEKTIKASVVKSIV